MTVAVDACVLVVVSADTGSEGEWTEPELAEDSLPGPELALAEARNMLRGPENLETRSQLFHARSDGTRCRAVSARAVRQPNLGAAEQLGERWRLVRGSGRVSEHYPDQLHRKLSRAAGPT